MPSVVVRALAPVCDFQRPDLPDRSHFVKHGLHLAVTPKRMERFCLVGQQLLQVIPALVRSREREHVHATASRVVCRHGRDDFSPSTFRNLGSADRADPNGAAGLQARIAGRAVLDGLVDLDLFGALPDAQTVVCP